MGRFHQAQLALTTARQHFAAAEQRLKAATLDQSVSPRVMSALGREVLQAQNQVAAAENTVIRFGARIDAALARLTARRAPYNPIQVSQARGDIAYAAAIQAGQTVGTAPPQAPEHSAGEQSSSPAPSTAATGDGVPTIEQLKALRDLIGRTEVARAQLGAMQLLVNRVSFFADYAAAWPEEVQTLAGEPLARLHQRIGQGNLRSARSEYDRLLAGLDTLEQRHRLLVQAAGRPPSGDTADALAHLRSAGFVKITLDQLVRAAAMGELLRAEASKPRPEWQNADVQHQVRINELVQKLRLGRDSSIADRQRRRQLDEALQSERRELSTLRQQAGQLKEDTFASGDFTSPADRIARLTASSLRRLADPRKGKAAKTPDLHKITASLNTRVAKLDQRARALTTETWSLYQSYESAVPTPQPATRLRSLVPDSNVAKTWTPALLGPTALRSGPQWLRALRRLPTGLTIDPAKVPNVISTRATAERKSWKIEAVLPLLHLPSRTAPQQGDWAKFLALQVPTLPFGAAKVSLQVISSTQTHVLPGNIVIDQTRYKLRQIYNHRTVGDVFGQKVSLDASQHTGKIDFLPPGASKPIDLGHISLPNGASLAFQAFQVTELKSIASGPQETTTASFDHYRVRNDPTGRLAPTWNTRMRMGPIIPTDADFGFTSEPKIGLRFTLKAPALTAPITPNYKVEISGYLKGAAATQFWKSLKAGRAPKPLLQRLFSNPGILIELKAGAGIEYKPLPDFLGKPLGIPTTALPTEIQKLLDFVNVSWEPVKLEVFSPAVSLTKLITSFSTWFDTTPDLLARRLGIDPTALREPPAADPALTDLPQLPAPPTGGVAARPDTTGALTVPAAPAQPGAGAVTAADRFVTLVEQSGGRAVLRSGRLLVTPPQATESGRTYTVFAPASTDPAKIAAEVRATVAQLARTSVTTGGILVDLSRTSQALAEQAVAALGAAPPRAWRGRSVYLAGPHGPPMAIADAGGPADETTRPWGTTRTSLTQPAHQQLSQPPVQQQPEQQQELLDGARRFVNQLRGTKAAPQPNTTVRQLADFLLPDVNSGPMSAAKASALSRLSDKQLLEAVFTPSDGWHIQAYRDRMTVVNGNHRVAELISRATANQSGGTGSITMDTPIYANFITPSEPQIQPQARRIPQQRIGSDQQQQDSQPIQRQPEQQQQQRAADNQTAKDTLERAATQKAGIREGTMTTDGARQLTHSQLAGSDTTGASTTAQSFVKTEAVDPRALTRVVREGQAMPPREVQTTVPVSESRIVDSWAYTIPEVTISARRPRPATGLAEAAGSALVDIANHGGAASAVGLGADAMQEGMSTTIISRWDTTKLLMNLVATHDLMLSMTDGDPQLAAADGYKYVNNDPHRAEQWSHIRPLQNTIDSTISHAGKNAAYLRLMYTRLINDASASDLAGTCGGDTTRCTSAQNSVWAAKVKQGIATETAAELNTYGPDPLARAKVYTDASGQVTTVIDTRTGQPDPYLQLVYQYRSQTKDGAVTTAYEQQLNADDAAAGYSALINGFIEDPKASPQTNLTNLQTHIANQIAKNATAMAAPYAKDAGANMTPFSGGSISFSHGSFSAKDPNDDAAAQQAAALNTNLATLGAQWSLTDHLLVTDQTARNEAAAMTTQDVVAGLKGAGYDVWLDATGKLQGSFHSQKELDATTKAGQIASTDGQAKYDQLTSKQTLITDNALKWVTDNLQPLPGEDQQHFLQRRSRAAIQIAAGADPVTLLPSPEQSNANIVPTKNTGALPASDPSTAQGWDGVVCAATRRCNTPAIDQAQKAVDIAQQHTSDASKAQDTAQNNLKATQANVEEANQNHSTGSQLSTTDQTSVQQDLTTAQDNATKAKNATDDAIESQRIANNDLRFKQNQNSTNTQNNTSTTNQAKAQKAVDIAQQHTSDASKAQDTAQNNLKATQANVEEANQNHSTGSQLSTTDQTSVQQDLTTAQDNATKAKNATDDAIESQRIANNDLRFKQNQNSTNTTPGTDSQKQMTAQASTQSNASQNGSSDNTPIHTTDKQARDDSNAASNNPPATDVNSASGSSDSRTALGNAKAQDLS